MVLEGRRSVLGRALRVLDSFTADASTLTLSDISRRAELPVSTTFRLVTELAEWGALERSPSGTYRVGLRLWEVASLAPRAVGVRHIALPFIQDLYEITHHSVHLAVREGDELVFVERLIGRNAPIRRPRIGGRYALHATGVGLVLLAHAPADLQESVLSAPLHVFTPYTYRTERDLRKALADVRQRGYAVSDRQVNPEMVAVAAPVHGHRNEVIAALSVVVPHEEADPAKLSQLVRTTTRAISRSCGAPR
ncbi:MAG: helix-turn-helix domain-containing protein [Pseudonocardiaceae bacterium]|nr:helix-turn-helix domain-containing protein [Pseudonocardiaceae bacterium]